MKLKISRAFPPGPRNLGGPEVFNNDVRACVHVRPFTQSPTILISALLGHFTRKLPLLTYGNFVAWTLLLTNLVRLIA